MSEIVAKIDLIKGDLAVVVAALALLAILVGGLLLAFPTAEMKGRGKRFIVGGASGFAVAGSLPIIGNLLSRWFG